MQGVEMSAGMPKTFKSWILVIVVLGAIVVAVSVWRYAGTPVAPLGTMTTDELLRNPQRYDGQVLKVFGRITDLGHLRCPCFTLDSKPIVVWYLYNGTNIHPSQIEGRVQNGDLIVVTGRFRYSTSPGNEYTIYAETIEKVST